MASLINSVVQIDGVYYAVQQGTYIRRWTRSFSSNLAANIIRLNFVDRGPGVRVYSFQIICRTWENTTLPFQQGANANFDAQRSTLESSYGKVATALTLLDPFGEPPTFSGNTANAITAGNTSFTVTSDFANLVASPPTINATYPYNMYVWAIGTSLGAGLAGKSTLDTVAVSAVTGSTITCSAFSHNWSIGANVAVPLGVFLTNLNQIDVPDMTSSSPRLVYEVEATEATQVVA